MEIQHFIRKDTIEIRDEMMYNFYSGLPHMNMWFECNLTCMHIYMRECNSSGLLGVMAIPYWLNLPALQSVV